MRRVGCLVLEAWPSCDEKASACVVSGSAHVTRSPTWALNRIGGAGECRCLLLPGTLGSVDGGSRARVASAPVCLGAGCRPPTLS